MGECMMMKQQADSLWSPDIKPGILSPRDILDLQAIALREQTDGLLNAEVRTVLDRSEGAVYLILDVIAPTLGDERHRILTARHFADRIYPCHLDAQGLRSAEVAHSDPEFRELVRQVLHSGEVKAMALSLIVRAKDSWHWSPSFIRKDSGSKHIFRPAWRGVETEGEETNGYLVEALYDERSTGD